MLVMTARLCAVKFVIRSMKVTKKLSLMNIFMLPKITKMSNSSLRSRFNSFIWPHLVLNEIKNSILLHRKKKRKFQIKMKSLTGLN